MAADPLDQVLRLVAEGRLTADEAGPILAALDERSEAAAAASPGPRTDPGAAPDPSRDEAPGGSAPGAPRASDGPSADPFARASSLRLEVRENGRQVVNLRLPIAVGRLALERVPGLSGEQVERVREAMTSGMRGPILQVEDGTNRVLIVLE